MSLSKRGYKGVLFLVCARRATTKMVALFYFTLYNVERMGQTRGLFIGILIGVLALGAVGFFIFFKTDAEPPAVEAEPSGPVIKLTTQGPKAFTLAWSNLPPETRSISIYKDETKWKTVPNIGNPSQGKTEFKSEDPPKPAEKITFKVISSTSTTLYTSTTTVTQSTTTVSGSAGGSSTSTGGGQSTSTTGGGTSTSTTGGTSTSTATSTLPGRTESFWAERTGGQIEIGWQNLPAGSVRLAVSRSPSTVAPWTTIITARGPFASGPQTRFIADDHPATAMYYKLEAFSSFDGLLGTFGPVLLDPISP